MRRIAITMLIAATGLSACGFGGSRLNPLNWFGGDSVSEPIVTVARQEPVAQQITELKAAPTPGGLIISAVALPATEGYWNAELVRASSTDAATYVLDFRLLPPIDRAPVGTPRTREVLAGVFLSSSDLQGITAIAVQGATNRRVIRRQ